MSAEAQEPVLSREHAQELVDQIREWSTTVLDGMAMVDQLVMTAYQGRAWLALGYESWDELCSVEFAQARMWATIEERRDRVQALTQAGLSTRAIGAVLGIGKDTAHRDALAGVSSETPAKDAMGPDALATVSSETVAKGLEGADVLATDANASVAKPVTSGDAGRVAEIVEKSSLGNAVVQGLDGRAYPGKRGTAVSKVERQLETVHLRSQGLTQQQIAEQLGVSQRTISSDLGEIEAIIAPVPDLRERAAQGKATVQDLIEQAGLVVEEIPPDQLVRDAEYSLRDLQSVMSYLAEEVIWSDEFVTVKGAKDAVCQAIGPGLLELIADLLALLYELPLTSLPAEMIRDVLKPHWTAFAMMIQKFGGMDAELTAAAAGDVS
ncbi:helix-turn-helix domain-containing protein [Devriesea agamarum]|uniref:helix-turn-helix domain-containing protein n=1 Tax=Devriesea agamarum TaxID=472569 RepID=UPI00071D5384|nr:helix-turn-helix domain-containing protein [Devriesea agamarum]